MAVGALTYFYKRLGARYPLVFMAVELQTALVIVGGTLALFTFYFDGDTHEYLIVLGIALVLTELAILASLWRSARQIDPIRDWIGGERDEALDPGRLVGGDQPAGPAAAAATCRSR